MTLEVRLLVTECYSQHNHALFFDTFSFPTSVLSTKRNPVTRFTSIFKQGLESGDMDCVSCRGCRETKRAIGGLSEDDEMAAVYSALTERIISNGMSFGHVTDPNQPADPGEKKTSKNPHGKKETSKNPPGRSSTGPSILSKKLLLPRLFSPTAIKVKAALP